MWAGRPTGAAPAGSDAATLRRAAPVVRDRRYVGDARHLQPGALQGAGGGFAARARALDEDVDLAQAVFHGALRGAVGGHLRGVRGALAAPLEARRAGA